MVKSGFLRKLIGGGAKSAVLVSVGAGLLLAGAPARGRSYTVGYYSLELDGLQCGIMQSFSGGDSEGDATVSVGLSMADPVKDWIDASLALAGPVRSGALKTADEFGVVGEVLQFENARITQIAFPAFDGTSTVEGITFNMRPERVTRGEPSGSLDLAGPQPAVTGVRVWLDGVPLQGIVAVSAPTAAIEIKQSLVADQVGMEVADLKLRASDVAATTLRTALDRGGKHHMVLDYLAAGRVVLALSFQGVGIFKISRGSADPTIDEIIADAHVDGLSLAPISN